MVFVTGNAKKLEEVVQILGGSIPMISQKVDRTCNPSLFGTRMCSGALVGTNDPVTQVRVYRRCASDFVTCLHWSLVNDASLCGTGCVRMPMDQGDYSVYSRILPAYQ